MISFCQTEKKLIYNPSADAKAELQNAIQKAKKENKNVLIQVGGNWCPWCIKFHNYLETTPTLDSLVKADYVFILVNYSKENKNEAILKELEYPQRFGFPVLLVLNTEGKRIHTQDSGLLESGEGYDFKKVKGFLSGWTVRAVNPETK